MSFLTADVRGYAQGVIQLPAPGTRLALSLAFAPPLLKGIKVYRNDPFRFDFIFDKGDDKATDEQIKTDSTRLIKYFLASLTVPEKDLWVNLSPYEKDRIVPKVFGQTQMGRDLLAQDYILKQITASVIYPDEKAGKVFWDKVYAEALKRYGTTDVPIDTFNKVWIIPEKATVYENKDAAFVVESRLKVMLETDYMAMERADIKSAPATPGSDTTSVGKGLAFSPNEIAKNVLREIIVPILEKEVNEGKNFTALRQVYDSLILATWYKRKVKASIMGQAYVDKQKTGGIDIADKNEKEKIWAQYVEAFKKGAYNLIKEEVDPSSQEVVPRKYFSGGTDLAMKNVFNANGPATLLRIDPDRAMVVEMKAEVDMASGSKKEEGEVASVPKRSGKLKDSKELDLDEERNMATSVELLSSIFERSISYAEHHAWVLLTLWGLKHGFNGLPAKVQPIPAFANFFRRTNIDKLLAAIPSGSAYLGAGGEALVLKTPDGFALRIEIGRMSRPKADGLLQPVEKTRIIGDFRLEKLPLTLPVMAEELKEAVVSINARLKKDGYRLHPNEIAVRNIHKLAGIYYVIDPGAVELDASMGKSGQIDGPAEEDISAENITAQTLQDALTATHPDATIPLEQFDKKFAQEERKKLEGVSVLPFDRALGVFESLDESGIGYMYRLQEPPRMAELRQLASYDGEIVVGRIRGTNEWIIRLHNRFDHVRRKGGPGRHFTDDALYKNLSNSDMIEEEYHNHPKGRNPIPSLMDLGVALSRNSRMFLITKESLIEFDARGVVNLNGRILMPGYAHEVNEQLQDAGVRMKEIAEAQNDQRIELLKELYLQIHFQIIEHVWKDSYERPERSPSPGMVALLKSEFPQERIKALSFFDNLLTDSRVFPAEHVNLLGWYARNDPVFDVRLFAYNNLKNWERLKFLEIASAAAASELKITGEPRLDNSMTSKKSQSILAMGTQDKGGIDLNPSRIDMATKNSDEEIQFDMDPSMLQRLQNASGVTPVVVGIHSLESLQRFMGVSQ